MNFDDSNCFSNYLRRNFAHKNKIIKNFKKGLNADKFFRRNHQKLIDDKSLQTINYESFSTAVKIEEEPKRLQDYDSSQCIISQFNSLGEIKLNSQSNF